MWYWHGMGGWGWIMMVAFWALVVLLIVWIARPSRTSEPSEKGASDVLDERFAKGEIDAKDYEERRAILMARK